LAGGIDAENHGRKNALLFQVAQANLVSALRAPSPFQWAGLAGFYLLGAG